MTCAPAISSILTTNAGLLALLGKVGGKPAVFPNHLPAGVVAYPVIVYRADKCKTDTTFSGTTNIGNQKVSVVCLARSYDGACSLANAVEAALVGAAGTTNGVKLSGVYLDDESESAEGLADTGDAFEVHQKEVTLDVWFRAS